MIPTHRPVTVERPSFLRGLIIGIFAAVVALAIALDRFIRGLKQPHG